MNWIESEFSLSFSDLFAEWEWLKILNLKSLNRFMRYYKCKYIFACVTQGKIWLWYLIIWIITNKFFPSFEKTSKRFIYIKFFISNEKKLSILLKLFFMFYRLTLHLKWAHHHNKVYWQVIWRERQNTFNIQFSTGNSSK